jgi:hypothetical protein
MPSDKNGSGKKPAKGRLDHTAESGDGKKRSSSPSFVGRMLRPGVPSNMPPKPKRAAALQRQAVGVGAPARIAPPVHRDRPARPTSAAELPSSPPADGNGEAASPKKKKLHIGSPPMPVAPKGEAADDPQLAADALAAFDPNEVLRHYLDGDHTGALRLCFDPLTVCLKTSFIDVSDEIRHNINRYVETFLYILTRPDIVVSRDQTYALLACQHAMANLVALSSFAKTDPQLSIISKQKGNFGKTLFLYTALNEQYIHPKQFFDADPQVASLWYVSYALGAPTTASEHVWENKKRHYAYVDERLQTPDTRVNSIMFDATYINDDDARRMKIQLNKDIQRQIGTVNIRMAPVRDRVAIVSARWRPGTAVHRSISPLVDSLRDKYRLTLVHFGPHMDKSQVREFDEVRGIRIEDKTIDCTEIKDTNFQVVFYPDIGMSSESIWLSNMRLAPIQCVGYGHPTTTAGSLIDYFIGGAEVELAEKAKDFYTERLVLLPGLGAVPVYPLYAPRYPKCKNDTISISLAWGATKINYPMLLRLKAIIDRSRRPVFFKFFPGSGAVRYSSLNPLLREMGKILGKNARIYSERRYEEYMAEREDGHFALDSYPFGGYNTVVDALHIGHPVVTQEGDRFYNRASSALLRRVGLEELIAHSEEEYVEKAVRLANDDDYRERLQQHLRETDLKACLYEDGNAQYFRKAIDYLIENHDRLQREKSREPIYIR